MERANKYYQTLTQTPMVLPHILLGKFSKWKASRKRIQGFDGVGRSEGRCYRVYEYSSERVNESCPTNVRSLASTTHMTQT